MTVAGERERSEPAASARAPSKAAARRGAPSLTHQPALDGLRGLAVAVVVLFHLGRLEGGFLGVDLFFVLSGYLITSLLLVEHRGGGRIDLRRFWARRARRLLPALFLALVGSAALLLALTPSGQRPGFRGDALATLGYVANWYRMGADTTYWDMFNQPSPLDHTWSLAIEEQFYLVWPLVVAALLGLVAARLRPATGRAGLVGMAAGGGAVVSFGLLALLYSPLDTNRAYFGTDTRIGPTLVGAALAAYLNRAPATERPDRVEGSEVRTSPALARWGPTGAGLAGLAGLAWMGWSVTTVDGIGQWYYRGGLLSFSLAAVVVIVVAIGGPSAAPVPGANGAASSATPVAPALSASRDASSVTPAPPAAAVREMVGRLLSWPPLRALGVVSYGVYLWHWPVIVYLTPERFGRGGLALDATRVVVTLLLATLSYRLVERPIRLGVLQHRRPLWLTAAAVTVVLGAVLLATAGRAADQSTRITTVPADLESTGWSQRILMVGDSGVRALGPAFVEQSAARGIAVATSADNDCTVVYPEGVRRHDDGRISGEEPCHGERRAAWADLVDEVTPDLVVYYLANAGTPGEYRLDGEWVTDCHPVYDRYLAEALADEIEMLQAGGARTVILTSPYIAVLDQDSARRVDCRNELYREVAAGLPRTEVIDLNSFVQQAVREHGVEAMLVDWVHFSTEGADRVSEWLLPQLIDR